MKRVAPGQLAPLNVIGRSADRVIGRKGSDPVRFAPSPDHRERSEQSPYYPRLGSSAFRRRGSGSCRADWFRDALDLVVLVVGIDLIEIVALAKNVFRGEQTCFNRVVGVVVTERAIATNDLQVVQFANK